MKTLFILIAVFTTTETFAETCSAVIKNLKNNQEFETITRTSYSSQAACDLANHDCRERLSIANSEGKYLNAECVVKTPETTPPPTPPSSITVCLTGLFDFYYRELKSYAAPGVNNIDACNNSYNFCIADLSHFPNNYGYRCMVKGILDTSSNPQTKSAECSAVRLDNNGTFIQNYVSKAIGSIDSDVKSIACQQSLDACTRDLKDKQACTITSN